MPPGFTITTEACRAYLASGGVQPSELAAQVDLHLDALQAAMGKRLGDPEDPLLVSVRSGSKFSMPGMETVLDVGLNDASVHGLARIASDDRLAWDSYRRLIQMFGKTVLGIDGAHFDEVFDPAKRARRTSDDLGLDADDLRVVVVAFQGVVREQTGREFPQDPREQLDMTVRAVSGSWNARGPSPTAARNASPPTWAPPSAGQHGHAGTALPGPVRHDIEFTI